MKNVTFIRADLAPYHDEVYIRVEHITAMQEYDRERGEGKGILLDMMSGKRYTIEGKLEDFIKTLREAAV